jgi:RNA polymerase sigma-70 factor, ECF subfamily
MLGGDGAAFQEFFDGHFERLYRFTLARAGDEDLAEEIVQAAFINSVRHLASFRGESSLFTWLCAICRRELGARRERAARYPMIALEEDVPEIRAKLEAIAAAALDPDAELRRRELSRLVHVALDTLPGRYGDVLEWKYLEGLPVASIAERLKTTQKAAESLLTRARNAFREAFSTLTASRPTPTPRENQG